MKPSMTFFIFIFKYFSEPNITLGIFFPPKLINVLSLTQLDLETKLQDP